MTKFEDLGSKLTIAAPKAPTYATECTQRLNAALSELRSGFGWPEANFTHQPGTMRADGHLPFTMKLTLKPNAHTGQALTIPSDFDVEFLTCDFWGDGQGQFYIRMGERGHAFPLLRDPRDREPQSVTLPGYVVDVIEKHIAMKYPTHG